MKNLKVKICSIMLAVLIAFSAAACQSENKTNNVQTADTPAETASVVEAPDIGEHKDYDKQNAKCFDSNGILIVEQDGKKRGIEIFDSGEGTSEFYGNELNTMKDRLGSKINVYSMIVPTACELYCPANMRGEISSQEEVMNYVRDMLVNVEEVNVLPTLINHNAENIYFGTDNRWTGLGAYYAGKVFAKAAGVDYADISEYTERTVSKEYVGNLSITVDDEGQKALDENPDTFIYYEPKINFKTHYYDEEFEYLTEDKFFEKADDSLYDSYYKGGYYCLKLSTPVNTSRKLIIVKDDYGTVLAPFFTKSFSEIYVVDIEYLEANLVEMIEEFCITDVLYVMNTFSATGSKVYKLETLRSQASHGTLEDNAPVEIIEPTPSAAPTETDTDTSEDTQFVYDVGVNNPIGVIVDSQMIDIDEYYNNIEAYTSSAADETEYEYENEYDDGYDEGENDFYDYDDSYDN